MYTPSTPELGVQPIALNSTTQNHPPGYQITAYDPTFGSGSFIYLEGVANTLVGSLVTYDQDNKTTTLAPNTAHLAQPLAVAMSACVAAQWGWYQVGGAAVIKKTAVKVNPGVQLFLSGTAGRVMPTVASGKEILNTITVNAATVASATSTIVANLQFPFAQGQVI